jgi:hypothetical protein
VSAVAIVFLAFLPPREAPYLPRPAGPATAAPSKLTLAWNPVAGASRYRVELWYRGQRAFTALRREASLVAPAWLRPGRYAWRVYLADEQGRQQSAGPVEHGWLIVPQ